MRKTSFESHYQYQGPALIKDFDFVKSVLRTHEGRKLRAYNPGDNHLTIGTGFNLDRKDAATVLKACGIPHRVDALKTCGQTLTPSQAQRLEDYTINEAAINAAAQLGGERFTLMTPAQQAAAISLATNSPRSMKEIAGYIREGKWNDDFLQDKVKAAEARDKVKYGGLHTRYHDIQECLKKGDFPSSFYNKNKIPHSNLDTPQPPAMRESILGSSHLIDSEQMRYYQMMRDKVYAMANAVNGPLGDQLKQEALKIGVDGVSPLTHFSAMVNLGFAELKAPNSRINLDNFQEFTRYSSSIFSDLAKDHVNLAHCVGFTSSSLGFDDAKLSELTTPFMNAAASYQTIADSMNDLYGIFSKPGIGDTSQPLSAFQYGTGKIFQEVPNKVTLLEQHLDNARDSFKPISTLLSADDAATTWSQVFNGVASTATDKVVIEDTLKVSLSNHPSVSEHQYSEKSATDNKNNLTLGMTIGVAQSSVQFLAVLSATFGHSDTISKVASIAVPALSIASTLCMWGTIAAASGPAAPYVAVAGALVTLVVAIAGLCRGPQGPTPDEIILAQLGKLHIHMDKRFDRLEKYIEGLAKHLDVRADELRQLIMQSHELLSSAIESLGLSVRDGFMATYNKINNLQKTLDNMVRRQEALFQDKYSQEFRRILLFSHQLTVQQLGQRLNPNDDAARRVLLGYYQHFYSSLVDDASQETLSGTSYLTAGSEAQELANILKKAFQEEESYQYESCINPIVAYTCVLDPTIESKRYANPFFWSKASKGFVKFITNNPAFLYGHSVTHLPAKKAQQVELNSIQEKGRSLMSFLLALQTNKVFWDKLFDRYQDALRDLVIEIYKVQWPSSTQSVSHAENAVDTLEHSVGLKVLAMCIDDYINGRAGPAATHNIFHSTCTLPVSLTAQFPNPGYYIFPGLFVHNLRASEIRFHAAYHMRTIGRETLRPYLGGTVNGDTNDALEDAVKNIHNDLKNHVNDIRGDNNAGGNYDFSFAETTKKEVAQHQTNWENKMVALRAAPTNMRTADESTLAINYGNELLKRSAAKLAEEAAKDNKQLPNRDLMKRAYNAHGNGALDVSSTQLLLNQKLDSLDDHAYLLMFFTRLLLPMYPQLQVHFKEAVFDKLKVIEALRHTAPAVLVLHNLLEREHIRLKTYFELLKDALYQNIDEVKWKNKDASSIAYIDENLAESIDLLNQFEALYFTFNAAISSKQGNKAASVVESVDANTEKLNVPGDGNCFFSSISLLLERNRLPKKTAAELRQEAVNYLRRDTKLHVGFGEAMELGTLRAFCTRMENDNVWAEGPIIDATAKMLDAEFYIIDSAENNAIPHMFKINEKGSRKWMLAREGERHLEHYSPVVKVPKTQPASPVKEKMTPAYSSQSRTKNSNAGSRAKVKTNINRG